MTIRFAGPRSVPLTRLRAGMARAIAARTANDNGDQAADAALDAALRHFAEHGLAAPLRAARAAEAALLADDCINYRAWLQICRALDPRMARSLETRARERNRTVCAPQQGVLGVNRSVITSG